MIQYVWNSTDEGTMQFKSLAISPYGGTTFIGMVNDGTFTYTCKIGGSLLATDIDTTNIDVTNITSTGDINLTPTSDVRITVGNLIFGNSSTHIVGPNSAGVNFSITNYAGNNIYLNNDKISNYGDLHINSNSNNSDTFVDKGDVTIVEGSVNVTAGNVNVANGDVFVNGNITSDDIDTVDIRTTNLDVDNIASSGTVNINCDCKMSNSYNLVRRELTAGYLINGTSPNTMYPIICSITNIVNDCDDSFIICAGYTLGLYSGTSYSTYLGTLDNSTGTQPLRATSTSIYGSDNSVSSVRVYYLGTEITLSGIS